MSITFGGYTFLAGFRVTKRERSMKLDEAEILGFAGTNTPPSLGSGMVLTIEGSIGGGEPSTAGTVLASAVDVHTELNLIEEALENGLQSLDLGDTPARTALAMKKRSDITHVEGYGRRFAVVAIELYLPDARFLGVAQTATDLSGTMTNNGSDLSYPVVTIAGATNPSFFVSPAGRSGAIGVQLALSGDVVIDCDPRRRARAILSGTPPDFTDGVPRLDALGTTGLSNTVGDAAFFPYLPPGASSYTVTGATGVSIAWSDAWKL